MWNIGRLFLVVLLTSIVFVSSAEARRVALVIGNSAYAEVETLKNPANDANSLAAALKSIGFDKVTLKLDLGQSQLRRALGQFSRDAAGADIALIYFAGHGIEVGGTNYLIPVDAALKHVDDVSFEALSLDTVMASLNRAGKLKLVILDACRNNPFRQSMETNGSKRSVGRGLARTDPTGSDTLIAYAAKEGTEADDGDGDNSPYAAALLKHLPTPGLDVRLLFGRVRDEVLASTGRRQEPFTYGSLGGEVIYLKPDESNRQGESVTRVPPAETADKVWANIKDSNDVAVLEAFADRFKGSFYADTLARRRVEALTADREDKKIASVPPKLAGEADDGPSGQALLEQGYGAFHAGVHDKAARLFREASEKGNADAMYNLGVMLTNGQGVAKDEGEAVRWFRKAADKGHVKAAYNLGVMLANGRGVKRNLAEAVRWYRVAANSGDVIAMNNLAAMYNFGTGVREDRATAAKWLAKAIRNGNDHSLQQMTGNHQAWGIAFRREMQKILREAGVYSGRPNGRFGADTIKAIRTYAGND